MFLIDVLQAVSFYFMFFVYVKFNMCIFGITKSNFFICKY